MEAVYAHNMGPSPFFYYNPEPHPEQQRQHGHFSPHPQYSGPINFYPEMMKSMPTHYHYPQQQQHPVRSPPIIYSNGMFPQSMITPLASPQPVYHKPTTFMERSTTLYQLNTDCGPSTPPLSVSGSARSSPPSACLPTPFNGTFAVPQAFSGIKKGCEGGVFTENMSRNEWRSQSPPFTPVFVHPKAHASHAAAPTPTIATATQHPISPAPSPVPLSSTNPESSLDFCDPRDLTVRSSPASTFDFSITSPIVDCKKEAGIDFSVAPPSDFLGTTGLPSDALFGLEVETDFGTFDACGLSDNSFFSGHKRQRTDLVSFASEEENFLTTEDTFSDSDEDHLATAWFLNPSDLENSFCSDMSNVTHSGRHTPTNSSSDADSEAEYTSKAMSENGHQSSTNQGSSASVEGHNGTSENNMGSGSDEATNSAQQSASRRGRKQSLTDDPSKTFICHLCNRRFRRQEHLKRHYRSLHTHDKPFKCNDCGKSFSRSDNLAQHQRTHGTGTIALELNDPDEMDAHGQPMAHSPGSDSDRMAQILYQAAVRLAAPTTSESSSSLTDDSDGSLTAPPEKKLRKRKREE